MAWRVALVAFGLAVGSGLDSIAAGQADKNDPVRVTAVLKGRSPEAGGKERLEAEVVLEIAAGWHVYANPAGDETLVATTVSVLDVPASEVSVRYPKGKPHHDEALGTVWHYQGRTTIGVTVTREARQVGKPRSLELRVRYQACSDTRCLAPKTAVLSLPLAP